MSNVKDSNGPANVGGRTQPRAWKAAKSAAKVCGVIVGLYLVMRCVRVMADLFHPVDFTARASYDRERGIPWHS